MVMEYVVGKSLAQVIADDAPLHERRVVNIGGQILAALAEAHAYRILHRDLKPENVMIEARRGALDSVKVLDFGIAKMMLVGAGASTLTQAGLVCGTPGYMSPEQLRGDDVDGRSDLFSVGVVLYEMLTHKLPFDVHTPMEMLHRHLTEPIPPPSGRRGRPVSPELEQLVMRALSADRDERPGSAEEMRLELMGLTLDPDASGEGTEERLPTAILPRRDSPRGVRVQGRTTGNRSEAARPAAPPPPPAPGLPSRVSKARLTPRGQPSSVTPASGGTRTPSASSVASARTPSASNVAPASGGGTRSTPARGRSTAARPASALDPAVIDRIERRVTPFLGPIAHRLVRRISAGASTPGELCRQLATFIPSRRDARDFLAASRAELVGPAGTIGKPPTPPPARATGVAWDPAMLERARRDLAVHVGPLARLVVERICARARDPEELYRLLSLEIPSEEEREEFRRTAPAAHRADE
jgi:serine/threonine-protein kinase